MLFALSALILTFTPNASPVLAAAWGTAGFALLWDALRLLRQKIELDAEMPREMDIGAAFDLKVKITGAAGFITLRFDWPEGLEGPDEHTPSAQELVAWMHIPLRGITRGQWSIARIWLVQTTSLGLIMRIHKPSTDLSVRILPDSRWIRSGEIESQLQTLLFGAKSTRARGEGSDFHQLQEFQNGMDVRAIDWKQSARTRRLIVKEMRAEQNHQIILALDAGHLMAARINGLARLDHGINAALALSWAGALAGDQVGLFAYDSEPRVFVPPRPGREGYRHLQVELADIDYSLRETNHMLGLARLGARCPRRSLIVVFADFVDTTTAELMLETLGVMAKRHAIIFVSLRDTALYDRAESRPNTVSDMTKLIASHQLANERALVLRRLSDLGISVIDVRADQLSPALVSRYLDLKAREVL